MYKYNQFNNFYKYTYIYINQMSFENNGAIEIL